MSYRVIAIHQEHCSLSPSNASRADSGSSGWKRSIHPQTNEVNRSTGWLSFDRDHNKGISWAFSVSKLNPLGFCPKTGDIEKALIPRELAPPRAEHPSLNPAGGILTSLSGCVSACWLGWRGGGLLTRSLGIFFNRRHFVTLGAGPGSSPFWRHRCFGGLRFGLRLRKSWGTWRRSCRCLREVFSVLYKRESKQRQTDADTHHINGRSETRGDSDTQWQWYTRAVARPLGTSVRLRTRASNAWGQNEGESQTTVRCPAALLTPATTWGRTSHPGEVMVRTNVNVHHQGWQPALTRGHESYLEFHKVEGVPKVTDQRIAHRAMGQGLATWCWLDSPLPLSPHRRTRSQDNLRPVE